jgi:hypothetical protein
VPGEDHRVPATTFQRRATIRATPDPARRFTVLGGRREFEIGLARPASDVRHSALA